MYNFRDDTWLRRTRARKPRSANRYLWNAIAGGSRDGVAPGGRGFFATIANTFSSVVGGASRPPALTADADTGAGLQGGPTVEV